MNQLAVIDDLAARRSAAARKAVATRRARLQNGVYPVAVLKNPSKAAVANVLAAFEREAQSDMPDWYGVALALKSALTVNRIKYDAQFIPKTKVPPALPPPAWPDYPVDHLGSFKVRNPTIVVTFANGEVVRAPAVSARDKPVNIGRGLRVAIAFCQARICRRAGLRFKPAYVRQVPAIVACVCEDTGEIYDAKQCTMRTIDDRKGRVRNRHDRRRAARAA
jgi:hypothetical protein